MRTVGSAFIGILAPTSYESTVASLAILAVGGVCVPISAGASLEELAYTLKQCSATCVLVGSQHQQTKLATQLQEQTGILKLAIPVLSPGRPPIESYTLDEDSIPSDDLPAFLFFTSGTTGAPKGVLHARRYLYAKFSAQQSELTDELCLIYDSICWSTCFISVLLHILRGERVELHELDARYDLIWDRFRDCEITKIHFSPTSWYTMMKVFQERISKLPEPSVQAYIRGAQYIRTPITLGGILPVPVKQFWLNLRGGRPIKVIYGSTEAGLLTVADPEASASEEASIGSPAPNVTVKLSDGDSGELLVKAPTLLLQYLNSPELTASCFDSEGFYKTGDLVERQGKNFIFRGRYKADFFKFWDHKIPRLHVESCLSSLPYIEEAHILPVADARCDNRVAALVRLRQDHTCVTLQSIRKDLSTMLPVYQMPTLLRILGKGDEVPRTFSEKVAMKKTVERFFPRCNNDHFMDDSIEVLGIKEILQFETTGPLELVELW
ncbi:AMP-binding enzyme [Aspergillus flavus]|nr:AMP-binding enzyme [Aspergillus flavus]